MVGSRSGAIPEVIGEAGLTFPEGDPAALREEVQAMREKVRAVHARVRDALTGKPS